MSSPFLTEPVALWEYLSLNTRQKCAANTSNKHPHTPNSSQTVTALNGTKPSWELHILFQPKPVDKCYNTASIIHSHRHVQSHSYIRRGNRRLSLAALPGLPAASRGVKLPLLANTRYVFQFSFRVIWSRASMYICKAETLAFTDNDYCQMLVL